MTGRHSSPRGMVAERLRHVLDYDPASGNFTWRSRPGGYLQWNAKHAGAVAGHLTSRGYVAIRIDRRLYMAHCLAWMWMTGEWSQKDIDHKNNNPADNRWDNLRQASPTQNGFNRRGPNKNNRSGYKGVSWNKGCWVAEIIAGGIRYRLGRFEDAVLAAEAYRNAAERLHGEFSGGTK